MLRSSWLWSDWRYRVVVGLIYDPGHLWPESTHDLIWGSSPVYAWPLTKRGPTSSIVCSKDLLRWHPQRALPAQCTRVRALERPSVLYLVHWKDPPVLYLCAIYGVLVGACRRKDETHPIHVCTWFSPSYFVSEWKDVDTKICLDLGTGFEWLTNLVPKLNLGYKRSWWQLNQDYKLVFWQLIPYIWRRKKILRFMTYAKKRWTPPFSPAPIMAYCHEFHYCIPSLYL